MGGKRINKLVDLPLILTVQLLLLQMLLQQLLLLLLGRHHINLFNEANHVFSALLTTSKEQHIDILQGSQLHPISDDALGAIAATQCRQALSSLRQG